MKAFDRIFNKLFHGKHIKLQCAGTIVFLMVACFCMLGTLTYVSMVSSSQYDISGLKVTQKNTAIIASWDETDADSYTVFLQCNGERPQMLNTDWNHCRFVPEELDKQYRITVTAANRAGGLSAAKSYIVTTRKLHQKIETERRHYAGLEGKKGSLEADAHGEMSYESSDPSVVEVSEDGDLTFMSEGRAQIAIHVDEGKQYRAADKTVPITVYPDTLKTPRLAKTELSDTEVTLKWSPVEFARGYTLRKYDPVKKRYRDYREFDAKTTSVRLNRNEAKYKIKATAQVGRDLVESELSNGIEITSTADSATTYGSSHNLGTLDFSTLDVVCGISGSGAASVPQSFSKVGDSYVVTYVNHGGSTGALVAYSRNGERLSTCGISGMGHANGSTYNPNTGHVYTVRTHKQIRSAECTVYDPETGSNEGSFQLPRVTSGIAYDESNNKFYLSKGNEVYVTDTDFNVEKFIWKNIRYNHAQDIGAYNGVALVCTWVAGNESYVDLYRSSDGAYLGSYYVPIGEIESVFVDNKHLIILMNNATGGHGDCILRTKEKIAIP